MKSSLTHLATKDDLAIVRKEISESTADIFKWMLIFWIGQIVATLAIAIIVLNK